MDDDNKRYADALEGQFKKRLLQAIQGCINKENDLNELYTKLIQSSQLPKGIVTKAEKAIGAFNREIEKYLRRMLTESKKKKKKIEIWKEYIKNNFEKLKKTVVVEEGQVKVDDPEAQEGINKIEEEEEEETDEEEEKETWRACPTSLQHIIREDLSVEVRDAFIETIKHNIQRLLLSAYIYSSITLSCTINLMF
jgi:hypothetical protein